MRERGIRRASLVTHVLRAPETYGVFGLVLGLIAWIYLLALVVVLAAEVNVVAQRRLWPRALLTPFTDAVWLTTADERYTAYEQSEVTRDLRSSTSSSRRPRVLSTILSHDSASGPI